MRHQHLHLLIGAAIMLAGCSDSLTSSGPTAQLADNEHQPKIISDRPIKRDNLIYTIKLTQPSVLELGLKNEQKIKEALATIENEQQETITKIKQLAPEAQILFRYRIILNGLAFTAPAKLQNEIYKLTGVSAIEPSRVIGRPIVQRQEQAKTQKQNFTATSVRFIDAERVHQELRALNDKGVEVAVRGQGIRIGVIDTGIDYTHKMLGGSGNAEEFKSVNPSQPSTLYPNRKVVGGIDLVGTEFDAGSETWSHQVPKPDANPIDEGAHGTHVAGTISGIGDGVNTYSGVAPDADLYAIKVFGANGSTSDFVVIAGLEFAADPNGDGDLRDRLDVVNLSLGSGFGQPQILYAEAVRNLTKGGTVVVASAGNSGDFDYIVGSPGTSTEAISVAASVDDMPHNWSFPAVQFKTQKNPDLLVKAVEGPASKPIAESGHVEGELVHIGLATKPLSPEEAAKVKGKVALIDRGSVTFLQKLQVAEAAGAIGAVVANNQPGEPMAMGGDGSVQIPAIMVSKDVGDAVKADMKLGSATIVLTTGRFVEERNLIDTITGFSSKGPRSVDSLLKPEISAPGQSIISAMMGAGDKGVQFSGTSMAAPHMAGVMGLLRQYRRDLSAAELKSIAMSTSKNIVDSKGNVYPLSRQGAGRVQTYAAALAPLTFADTAVSLGLVEVGQGKTLRRSISVKNTSTAKAVVQVSTTTQAGLKLIIARAFELQPGESKDLLLNAEIRAQQNESPFTELNGRVTFSSKIGEQTFEQQVPVLAIVTKVSDIQVGKLAVRAGGPGDGAHAAVDLQISNRGTQGGYALPFNLIGRDQRKPDATVTDSYRSRSCDLEVAGYRIIKKKLDADVEDVMQVVVKLYEPLTTWHACEVSVQFDSNNDQVADQELVGISASNLAGLGSLDFGSFLLDAVKAREIRLAYEDALGKGNEADLSYIPAVQDAQAMINFNHSTVAIVQTPLRLIKRRAGGELAIKIATLYADEDGLAPDDFLQNQLNRWYKVDPNEQAQGYYNLPEVIELAPKKQLSVSFTKGLGKHPLVVFMPNNPSGRTLLTDNQTKIVAPEFAQRKP